MIKLLKNDHFLTNILGEFEIKLDGMKVTFYGHGNVHKNQLLLQFFYLLGLFTSNNREFSCYTLAEIVFLRYNNIHDMII